MDSFIGTEIVLVRGILTFAVAKLLSEVHLRRKKNPTEWHRFDILHANVPVPHLHPMTKNSLR